MIFLYPDHKKKLTLFYVCIQKHHRYLKNVGQNRFYNYNLLVRNMCKLHMFLFRPCLQTCFSPFVITLSTSSDVRHLHYRTITIRIFNDIIIIIIIVFIRLHNHHTIIIIIIVSIIIIIVFQL